MQTVSVCCFFLIRFEGSKPCIQVGVEFILLKQPIVILAQNTREIWSHFTMGSLISRQTIFQGFRNSCFEFRANCVVWLGTCWTRCRGRICVGPFVSNRNRSDRLSSLWQVWTGLSGSTRGHSRFGSFYEYEMKRQNEENDTFGLCFCHGQFDVMESDDPSTHTFKGTHGIQKKELG